MSQIPHQVGRDRYGGAQQQDQVVACVGSGTIGSAWAALFASRGLCVQVYDPSAAAEHTLREVLARAAQSLRCDSAVLSERVSFTTHLAGALDGVCFVQESGPEDIAIKRRLYAEIDGQLPPGIVIASSTSDLPMSSIQLDCTHPERTIVGHPINPPYAVALVEVVAGRRTSQATIERACAFYRAMGRQPLPLEREAPGFVANRLQMALLREALQMVAHEEASVAQVDFALMHGIGVRWAAVGMFGAYFLNLKDCDVHAWLDHFERFDYGASIVHTESFPEWSSQLRSTVARQWQERIEQAGAESLLQQRDTLAIELARRRELEGTSRMGMGALT